MRLLTRYRESVLIFLCYGVLAFMVVLYPTPRHANGAAIPPVTFPELADSTTTVVRGTDETGSTVTITGSGAPTSTRPASMPSVSSVPPTTVGTTPVNSLPGTTVASTTTSTRPTCRKNGLFVRVTGTSHSFELQICTQTRKGSAFPHTVVSRPKLEE